MSSMSKITKMTLLDVKCLEENELVVITCCDPDEVWCQEPTFFLMQDSGVYLFESAKHRYMLPLNEYGVTWECWSVPAEVLEVPHEH